MIQRTNVYETKLRPLEFQVFRETRSSGPVSSASNNRSDSPKQRVLALVSGGADSMAMLRILLRLKSRLDFEIEVLHVHHGDFGENAPWRSRASALVRDFAAARGIGFHTMKSKDMLSSEADFRRFRWEVIESVLKRAKESGAPFHCIALAHHRDDLMETRLIRLLRGTGAQGLRAMKRVGRVRGVIVWRPLLGSSRKEIRDYLFSCEASEGRDWMEDQSNADPRYLRNVIRHQLLPQIEATRKGGVRALSRSLELIADEVESSSDVYVWSESASNESNLNESKLSRRELMSLSPEKQRAKLGKWLKSQGVESYSQAQIKEALKRLDTDQRRLRFLLCGRVWLVDEMVEIVALPRRR